MDKLKRKGHFFCSSERVRERPRNLGHVLKKKMLQFLHYYCIHEVFWNIKQSERRRLGRGRSESEFNSLVRISLMTECDYRRLRSQTWTRSEKRWLLNAWISNSQKTHILVIWCYCFAEDGRKMYQKLTPLFVPVAILFYHVVGYRHRLGWLVFPIIVSRTTPLLLHKISL